MYHYCSVISYSRAGVTFSSINLFDLQLHKSLSPIIGKMLNIRSDNWLLTDGPIMHQASKQSLFTQDLSETSDTKCFTVKQRQKQQIAEDTR